MPDMITWLEQTPVYPLLKVLDAANGKTIITTTVLTFLKDFILSFFILFFCFVSVIAMVCTIVAIV